jgi:hypothetical protein
VAQQQAAAQGQAAPGQLFGMPGLTQFTEQNENTISLAATLAQATATTVNGILPFKQVDVVLWWELDLTITQTYTAGTSTITSSPYGPYNWISALALQIQNQYSALAFTNGIDAAIFQMYRPMRSTDFKNDLDVSPATATATPWANTNLAQPTLQTSATAWTSAAASTTFTLELPASIGFDVYYDLDAAGNVVAAPHRAIVSPQYMAGTVRNIIPNVTIAAGSSSTLDVGPANIGAGSGTFTGSALLTFRRVGIYAGNPLAMPVTYAWQYLRATTPFQIAGSAGPTSWPVPTNGQILSTFVRMFDPLANAGLGAAIALTVVTKAQLQYGSALLRFDDTPKSAQRRFLRQHGFLPPVGVIIWDLALDNFGRLTNAYALNTLNTSGIIISVTFTVAQSAAAYAMIGVEALTYVL